MSELQLRKDIQGVAGICGNVLVVQELAERLESALNVMNREVENVRSYLDIAEENNALKRRLLLAEAGSMSKVRIKWSLGYKLHSQRLPQAPEFELSASWYQEYKDTALATTEEARENVTRRWRGVPGRDFRIPPMLDAYIEPILYRVTSRGLETLIVDDAGTVLASKVDEAGFKRNYHKNIQGALKAVISRLEEHMKVYHDYVEILDIWHKDANTLLETARMTIDTHETLMSPSVSPFRKKIDALLETMGDTLDKTESTNVVEECT